MQCTHLPLLPSISPQPQDLHWIALSLLHRSVTSWLWLTIIIMVNHGQQLPPIIMPMFFYYYYYYLMMMLLLELLLLWTHTMLRYKCCWAALQLINWWTGLSLKTDLKTNAMHQWKSSKKQQQSRAVTFFFSFFGLNEWSSVIQRYSQTLYLW